MLRLFLLVCALCCAASAHAADLARQSRLGEAFVERPARVIIRGRGEIEPPPIDAPIVHWAPKVPGYYGRPSDFAYRNYYGTSPFTIYSRLPYACGFVGLC